MKRTKKTDTMTCEFCRRVGIKKKADWKDSGRYACEEHKKDITIDDGYMSEGDYQSWGRL